jgi:hypothetical protein
MSKFRRKLLALKRPALNRLAVSHSYSKDQNFFNIVGSFLGIVEKKQYSHLLVLSMWHLIIATNV